MRCVTSTEWEGPMHMQNIFKKLDNLSNLIGNTPLLEITFSYKNKVRKIYAKAEYYNFSGSIKDRMALHILRKAYSQKKLSPEGRIIEATSGNTGISFAAIGTNLGHQVEIFMPDWMSEERKKLIQSFGARIRLVSQEEGGFLGSIQKTEEVALQDKDAFLPKQFSNQDNCEAHYLSTGPEIWWQLDSINLKPDAFVAGVGTGGTVMGIGRFLKKMNPKLRIHPLEPSNSPTMSTGYKVSSHRIQGISDEFIPPIIKFEELDEIISVDDGDAIIMAQKLSRTLGLGVGISSGANLLGAILAQEMLGSKSTVVTVFPDDNKKYLSTDLMKEELVKDHSLTPYIELQEIKSYARVCCTCKAEDEIRYNRRSG